MLITFKTNAYENISYFESVALSLLSLMGHSGTVPGAIKAEQVQEALNNLQQGLGQKKAGFSGDGDEEQPISLAKRAIPLIYLLQAAVKKNCDVLWDIN